MRLLSVDEIMGRAGAGWPGGASLLTDRTCNLFKLISGISSMHPSAVTVQKQWVQLQILYKLIDSFLISTVTAVTAIMS